MECDLDAFSFARGIMGGRLVGILQNLKMKKKMRRMHCRLQCGGVAINKAVNAVIEGQNRIC